MPRSGHHLLERCMRAVLQERFHYCSYYQDWVRNSYRPCCRTIPCRQVDEAAAVFMQKSHDFKLKDPLELGAAHLRVVQVRKPVPRLRSNYRLHLKSGVEDSRKTFLTFAERERRYYYGFWKKWVVGDRDAVLLPYEQFIANAAHFIRLIISELAIDGGIPEDLDELLPSALSTGGQGGIHTQADDDYELPWVAQDWAIEYEADLRALCPQANEIWGA